MTYSLKNPLFPLGRILIAPEIEFLGIDIARLLRNHQTGDFGCIDEYDVEQNHQAIECGDGILSQYRVIIERQADPDLRHDRGGPLLHCGVYLEQKETRISGTPGERGQT